MNGDLLPVVSSFDPAIDVQASDLAKWRVTRDHVKYLKFKNGKQPQIFWLRRIPVHVHAKYIESLPSLPSRHVASFECSVVRVDNMVKPDGSVIASWEPSWLQERDQSVVSLKNDELGLFHPNDIDDIGEVAYARCFLRAGSAPCYPLRPTSPHRLEMELLPPAEEVLKAVSRLREESQQESTIQDVESGEQPTDATVSASVTSDAS